MTGKCLHVSDPTSESLSEIFISIFNHHPQYNIGKAKLFFFSIDNFIFPATFAITCLQSIILGKKETFLTFPLLSHTFVSLTFLSSYSEEHPLFGDSLLPTFSSSTVLSFLKFFFLERLFLALPILLICLTVLPHRWLHLHKNHSRWLMWQQEQVA